jgi:hypothetical protein
MDTITITAGDRAALENLWNKAGTWTADTWTRLNKQHFGGKLKYHGIVWGLTPHGSRLGHTSGAGRITLHPALLDPQGEDPWTIGNQLGARFAEHVLLHEMIHVLLSGRKIERDDSGGHHNTPEWSAEITRITPQLGLPEIQAAPVKPRRVNGKVMRMPLDGHLGRDDIAHWPHSIAPAGYYTTAGRIHVPI